MSPPVPVLRPGDRLTTRYTKSMSRKLSVLFVVLSACFSAVAQPPGPPSPCANTPAYSPCEFVFDLSDLDAAAHPTPYVNVDLKAEFRSPHFRTFLQPAFWDGGRRMVIRFTPTEPGEWQYRLTSNIAAWDGKTGTFTAAPSDAPGFVRVANVHHWAYTERMLPHLWMGATELGFADLDDASFRSIVDARAAEKFNHLRGLVLAAGTNPGFSSPTTPDLTRFRRLDDRIRYINQKGLTADLIVASDPGQLTRLLPTWQDRQRFVRYLVARYAPFNVTWQLVQSFEGVVDGRAVLKEAGTYLKETDPYQHPRTAGAQITSAPLLEDRWMDFAAYGPAADDQVGAIEHQLYPVPFVTVAPAILSPADPATFRHTLWNATMDGQYVTAAPSPDSARQMTVWFNVLSDTRHWELEPYFDIDNGRAVALEGVEYLAYIEKPGPVELIVEKHSYDVLWINPIDGEITRAKFKGDHFTGEPPDKSHDWVLHVVREGRVESMNRSYKFESRQIVLQEIDQNTDKVPFAIDQPSADLTIGKPAPFSVKIKRETRATRSMMYLWTGEVTSDGQGYRVLATGAKGSLQVPAGIAKRYPCVMSLRLYGMNANGKVYALDKAFQLTE